jgi:hypothetical protein
VKPSPLYPPIPIIVDFFVNWSVSGTGIDSFYAKAEIVQNNVFTQVSYREMKFGNDNQFNSVGLSPLSGGMTNTSLNPFRIDIRMGRITADDNITIDLSNFLCKITEIQR